MAFYPQSILDEIRDRISIVSYIGEHVPLKKSGRNYKGLCPFHAEKTPSFMASDEKEIFHCFGCGEGGNIFSFVMKYEGLSFPEAVEHLAARAGVSLPKREFAKGEADQAQLAAKKKKLLFRVNELAAQFFRDSLERGASGQQARNYLKSRGIFDEISTQHFLGYADDSWDALFRHLKGKNVPLELAEELGLIKRQSATGEYYDFFRGRLIFPIISHRSEVLGFGGRVLAEGKEAETAKYINSSDSMIYHKSYSVYGLNVAQAEIRRTNKVIIVEGYMDVLALNQAGISNVVAPLGTALTSSHIRLLGRYSKNMVLIFDGDKAGLSAAERSLPAFMEVGIMPKIVVLPEGQDPDDWIGENSKSDFEQMADEADSLFAWLISKKAEDCGSDVSKRFGVISELEPLFRHMGGSVEFMYYRRLLSDKLKIDENDLIRQLEYKGKDFKSSLRTEKESMAGRLRTEKLLLSLMLEHPSLISRAGNAIDSSYLSDESFMTLFELLIEESKKEKFSVGRLLDRVGDDELVNSIHSLSLDNELDDESALNMLEDCMRYLTKCRLSERLRTITEEIKIAEDSKDEDRVLKLMTEKNELLSKGF